MYPPPSTPVPGADQLTSNELVVGFDAEAERGASGAVTSSVPAYITKSSTSIAVAIVGVLARIIPIPYLPVPPAAVGDTCAEYFVHVPLVPARVVYGVTEG
jgi:hypothetical protein